MGNAINQLIELIWSSNNKMQLNNDKPQIEWKIMKKELTVSMNISQSQSNGEN